MLNSIVSENVNSLLSLGGILFAFIVTIVATGKLPEGNLPITASFRRENPGGRGLSLC